MNYPIKKLTKTIRTSLLALPLVFSTSVINAAETVDEKIQKLEALVKELKKETQSSGNSSSNSYTFGGFIKATATFTDYSDGDIGAGSGSRDFYIPAAIPVGGVGESQDFDFGAKESRINFKSKHVLSNGHTLTTNVEMDFLLPPPGGNERVSNSYAPRLRHAYFTYDNWLFGQTWSTFQDLGALPESADFLGASDGIVFERQSMVRYTHGAFQIALENPESTITSYDTGGLIVTDDNSRPDLVLRYNHKANWGHVTVSGLVRQLAYNQGTVEESTSAAGISLTGKFKVGEKDDIRFNLATGSGMGRYVALNTGRGAAEDINGNLEAIDSTLASVAYRHHWNSEWRSNLIISGIEIDNEVVLDTGAAAQTDWARSVQVNLLYSPVPKLTLGVGYLSASREVDTGADGDLGRLIFTAKYGF